MISTTPTKVKTGEPAVSQALIQNKIDRQRVRSRVRQAGDSLWLMVLELRGEGGLRLGEEDEYMYLSVCLPVYMSVYLTASGFDGRKDVCLSYFLNNGLLGEVEDFFNILSRHNQFQIPKHYLDLRVATPLVGVIVCLACMRAYYLDK